MRNLFFILLFFITSCGRSVEDERIIKSIQENELERMERGLNADTSYKHAVERFERSHTLGREPSGDSYDFINDAFILLISIGIGYILGKISTVNQKYSNE